MRLLIINRPIDGGSNITTETTLQDVAELVLVDYDDEINLETALEFVGDWLTNAPSSFDSCRTLQGGEPVFTVVRVS